MTDQPLPPELDRVLTRSVDFFSSLSDILGDTIEVATHRDLLTQGTCRLAFEHGMSVFLLVDAGHATSAIALQRLQFEAVVRALWLHDVATDAWIDRYFAAVKANPMKDPNFSPSVGEMLEALSTTCHAPAVRMLVALKDAAWGPMNSYVHSGIHPVLRQHVEFPSEYAVQVLRNSNGLAGMAATLTAIMIGDAGIATRVRDAQLAHIDCLPPISPAAPP